MSSTARKSTKPLVPRKNLVVKEARAKRPADDTTAEPPAKRVQQSESVLVATTRQIASRLRECQQVVEAVARCDRDLHAYLNGLPSKPCAHESTCPLELSLGGTGHDSLLFLNVFRCGRYLGSMRVVATGVGLAVQANESLADSFTSARDVHTRLEEMLNAAHDEIRRR
jgi:hypothetical protein